MNLLFSMSLAGSLVFILYLIIKPVARRFLPASWRYWLLKVCLLFYLLPYQYFKFRYVRIGEYFFPGYRQNMGSPKPPDINRIILVDAEGNWHFQNQTVVLTVLGIWGTLVAVGLLYCLARYIHCMRNLQQVSRLPVTIPDRWHISKKHAQAKVPIYANPYIPMPFTVGLLSPRIILPAPLVDRKESQMIIAHEMAHIKNRDNLVKFLWLLVMFLHWYNPLIYLLYWEICKVSEQVCDASVIQGMSEQEKRQYQSLIIDLGQKEPPTDTLLASSFSGRYKTIKERINMMDRTAKFSKKIRLAASLVSAITIIMLSPISVLAYSPMITYAYLDEDFSLRDGILLNEPEICDPFLEYGTAHDIFIASDGQTYILDSTSSQAERATCNHNWQDGTLNTHFKNDDGSCTVYYYDCQICTFCNAKKNIVYNGKHEYLKCPH